MHLLISLLALTLSLFPCEREYELSGHLEKTYRYYGGIEQPDRPLIPQPLRHYSLWIVPLEVPKGEPHEVRRIESDENGDFVIKLPPGKYGFVETEGEMNEESCLPKDHKSGDEFETFAALWTSNQECPLVISDRKVENLTLTRNETKICYLCP